MLQQMSSKAMEKQQATASDGSAKEWSSQSLANQSSKWSAVETDVLAFETDFVDDTDQDKDIQENGSVLWFELRNSLTALDVEESDNGNSLDKLLMQDENSSIVCNSAKSDISKISVTWASQTVNTV